MGLLRPLVPRSFPLATMLFALSFLLVGTTAILIEFQHLGNVRGVLWEQDTFTGRPWTETYFLAQFNASALLCRAQMKEVVVPPCPNGTELRLSRDTVLWPRPYSTNGLYSSGNYYASLGFYCYQRAKQLCDIASSETLLEEVHVGEFVGTFYGIDSPINLTTIGARTYFDYEPLGHCNSARPPAANGWCSGGTEVARWTLRKLAGYTEGDNTNDLGVAPPFRYNNESTTVNKYWCHEELHLLCTLPGQRKRAVHKAGQGVYEGEESEMSVTLHTSEHPLSTMAQPSQPTSQPTTGLVVPHTTMAQPSQPTTGLVVPQSNQAISALLSTSEQTTVSNTQGNSSDAITPLLWPTNQLVSQLYGSDQPIVINSLTVLLPTALQGALITAPIISVSGTLTLDFSQYDGDTSSFQLFSSAPEGSFTEIVVQGVDSCVTAEMGMAGQVIMQNTCTSSAAPLSFF